MSLLDDSDKLKINIANGFTDALPGFDETLFKRLMRLLEELDSRGGYFVNEKASVQRLLALQSEIEVILEKAGYFNKVNTYIADLAKITENTIDLQKGINSLDIQKRSITGIERLYVNQVAQTMSEGGLSANFVSPVTTALNEAITYGYSIQTTRDNFEKSLLDTGPGKPIQNVRSLRSYLTVTARDTVSQLQGAQQQAIANEYKMKYLRYVGAILKHSRAQCVRWKEMTYIEMGHLQEEVDRALKLQKQKKEEGGHKYSGMILDTNAQNFCQKRGGHGCMHSVIPTLKKY